MMIRIPKIMTAKGHADTPGGITSMPGCCRNHMIPQSRITTPMAKPTIVPPRGIPKHSSSTCLRSGLREGGAVSRLAPHLVHTTASSSFFVPHLVQYTKNIYSPTDNGFIFFESS